MNNLRLIRIGKGINKHRMDNNLFEYKCIVCEQKTLYYVNIPYNDIKELFNKKLPPHTIFVLIQCENCLSIYKDKR